MRECRKKKIKMMFNILYGWQYLTLHLLFVFNNHKNFNMLFIYFYSAYNFVLIIGLLSVINLNLINLIVNLSFYIIFILGFTIIVIYILVKIAKFLININNIIKVKGLSYEVEKLYLKIIIINLLDLSYFLHLDLYLEFIIL